MNSVGHFPTRPQEILFDFTFLHERGAWRISSLNVGTRPAAGEAGDPPKAGEGAAPETTPVPPVKPSN